jgi:hypothetical protein
MTPPRTPPRGLRRGCWHVVTCPAAVVRQLRGDGYAIEQLLGAYGGMGSINDVVINNDSGNGTSEREGEATTTAELRTLLSAEPRIGTTSVASRPSVRSST